jgi:membrane dipeptidase
MVSRMSDSLTIPVFDGHNDTLLAYFQAKRGESASFFERSEQGHIDYPRALEGGLAGGFFAIFSPGPSFKLEELLEPTQDGFRVPLSPPRDHQGALQDTLKMAATLHRWARESQGRLRVVRTVQDIRDCMAAGVMAAILHLEGAEAIGPDLDALYVLFEAGLRSLGPVWSRQNVFATGVPFRFPAGPDIGDGLTPVGKDLVRACNELGVMIDLSHITEKGFWDVAKLSTAPLVATHSNAHAVCPVPRNLTDDQLAAIRDSDGMVGLNFAVGFLREDGGRDADTPLSVMVRHIDHLVEHLGIDRVGFGSDFDGATIPVAIGDVTGLPKLLAALKEAGYDDAALRKLAHENWHRVLEQTWKL